MQHVEQLRINIRPRLLEPFVRWRLDMRDSQPANLGP